MSQTIATSEGKDQNTHLRTVGVVHAGLSQFINFSDWIPTTWILDCNDWIPDSISWIPDSKAVDSGFHRPKLPGFRIPDYLTWGDLCVLRSKLTLHKRRQIEISK